MAQTHAQKVKETSEEIGIGTFFLGLVTATPKMMTSIDRNEVQKHLNHLQNIKNKNKIVYDVNLEAETLKRLNIQEKLSLQQLTNRIKDKELRLALEKENVLFPGNSLKIIELPKNVSLTKEIEA